MRDYVDGLIAAELPRALEAIGINMRDITMDATAKGALGNSRIFVQYQTVIVEGISTYGKILRERLAQFDAEHSPASPRDFSKAIASVDELSRRVIEIYEKKRENQKPFGGNGLPFDEGRLAVVIAGAKNELLGLQHEHASRRSMIGRWVRRGVDAFMQNLIFMLLLVILAFVLGAIFHQPVTAVLELFDKMKSG